MAETTLDVKTKVDNTEAVTSIEKLTKAIDQMSEALIQGQKDAKEAAEASAKATKESTKATKGLAKGFKGIGLAIKAAGIGLVIGALNTLKDVFMSNQAVADTVSTAMGTLTNVFNQFINPVIDSVKGLVAAEESFDALIEVGKSLITIVLTPIKVAFQGIKAAVLGAQLVWEKSFLGDNDPTTIKELEKGLEGVQKEMENIAVENIKAAVSIKENFVEAVGEIGNTFTVVKDGIIKGYNEIDVAAAASSANRITQLENQARIDEAVQRGVILNYARLAETQRQIRDDDKLTFEERTKANEELSRILEEQANEERKLIASRAALAQEQLKYDKDNIESKIALIDAETELADVEERINGFRSEYLLNRNSLEREAAAERKEIRDKEIDETLKALDKEKKESEAIQKSKQAAFTDITKKGFDAAQAIAGKSVEAQKGIAATQATFSTYEAIAGQLAAATRTPAGGIPGYAIAQAIATGAFGFLQVAKILSTSSPQTSGGGGGGGATPNIPQQQQDPIPNVGFLNNSALGDGQEAFRPQRAYVINQDIRNNNTLDEAIRDRSRI